MRRICSFSGDGGIYTQDVGETQIIAQNSGKKAISYLTVQKADSMPNIPDAPEEPDKSYDVIFKGDSNGNRRRGLVLSIERVIRETISLCDEREFGEMKKIICLTMTLCIAFMTCAAYAANAPREEDFAPREILVLRTNVKTVLPGGKVVFTMTSPEPVQVAHLVDEDLNGYEMKKSGSVFTCKMKMPEDFSGEKIFLAAVAEKYLLSPAVSIIVKPDVRKMVMLRFEDNERVFSAGGFFDNTVTAIFTDGKEYDFSDSKLGTTYKSTNPSVATVSANGRIKTLKAGKTQIIAENSGKHVILHLTVHDFKIAPSPQKP